MKTEKEKMLAGELYFAGDKELTNERLLARELLKNYNNCPEDQPENLKSVSGPGYHRDADCGPGGEEVNVADAGIVQR